MAHQPTYGKACCGICRKVITRNGLAMYQHMQIHVREGKVIKVSNAFTVRLGYLNMYRSPEETNDQLAPLGAYF